MKNTTRALLLKPGIPQHIKGYHFLGTAIEAVQENPNRLDAITKDLYSYIAKTHGSTSSRVERAIRHAIETAFDRCDLDTFDDIFGYSIDARRGKPTNKHFIAALAEVLNGTSD